MYVQKGASLPKLLRFDSSEKNLTIFFHLNTGLKGLAYCTKSTAYETVLDVWSKSNILDDSGYT